jgi:uncharacterized protein DUF5994
VTLIATDPRTAGSPTAPSTPRLRLQPAGTRHSLLDGGWWPRSLDPVAELPGLVLAIDRVHGPVTRLMLHVHDWGSHPRRLAVAGPVLRLGYFASHPTGLLTALCGRDGDRVDLLIVPPATSRDVADAAVLIAAGVGNEIHAQDIVRSIDETPQHRTHPRAIDTWETEGGRLATIQHEQDVPQPPGLARPA